MQHLLLNIVTNIKESKTQIDIVTHFTNKNHLQWYNTTYKDCRVYFHTYTS